MTTLPATDPKICPSCGEAWTQLNPSGKCYECDRKADLEKKMAEPPVAKGFETIRCPHCKNSFVREKKRGKRR